MKELVTRLIREDEGAAASEYAILVAFIAVFVAAAVKLFSLGDIFTTLSTKVKELVSGAAAT